MAIDTAFKRRSSAASRRLPWMRRFGIAPDGAITQPDRQQGTWVYAGISPEQPGPVPTIDVVRTHPVTRTITRTHHMS